MRPLRAWLLRLLERFDKPKRERELQDELESHLQLHVDDNVRAGMSLEEARRIAVLKLGGIEATKESYRDRRGLPWLETSCQDVGYGLRVLRKNPGFTAVATLTLGLGIGATTALFSVVYAVLIQALPYPEHQRLVMLWENVQLKAYKNDRNAPAPGNFAEWRSHTAAVLDMAAIRSSVSTLTGRGEPLRVQGQAVSSSFFAVLGVSPALGRAFGAEEDRPGGARVVVLSHELWVDRFGADPAVLGRPILLDGDGHVVIGVMPRGFRFLDPDELYWVPLALPPKELANFGSHYLRIVGRLKPGATSAQAQAEIGALAERLAKQYPSTNTGVGASVVPLREELVGEVRPALLVLLAAVGLVLLIVCANVASLLLARAGARRRELATRVALGASGARIVRQLLTESLLLALVGDCLGLVLAFWGIRGLPLLAPPNLPRIGELGLNGPVLAFSLAISLLAALVFGIAPAFQALRSDVRTGLKDERRELLPRSRLRSRHLLVVAETALGLVVLVGSGLLLRSFVLLQGTPLGFEPRGLLAFRISLPDVRYPRPSDRLSFYQRAFEKIESLPGVRSVGAAAFLPLTSSVARKGFLIEGQPEPKPGQLPMAESQVVTPGYFRTLQVPLLEGRDCAWTDTALAPAVVLVNRAMARAFWPNADALGQRIRLGPADTWLTIVGIVGDARQYDVQTQPRAVLYLPITQQYRDSRRAVRDWVVRSAGDPKALAPAVRSAIWQVDAELSIAQVRTMDAVWSAALANQRFNLLLLGSFACLALILAAVGLYGVTAYSVAQRSHELGIRIALGARPREILKSVLAQGAQLVLLGVAIGVVAALALAETMSKLLYGIGARDPLTFCVGAALLTLVSLAACYVPARRALRVDPIVALRCE